MWECKYYFKCTLTSFSEWAMINCLLIPKQNCHLLFDETRTCLHTLHWQLGYFKGITKKINNCCIFVRIQSTFYMKIWLYCTTTIVYLVYSIFQTENFNLHLRTVMNFLISTCEAAFIPKLKAFWFIIIKCWLFFNIHHSFLVNSVLKAVKFRNWPFKGSNEYKQFKKKKGIRSRTIPWSTPQFMQFLIHEVIQDFKLILPFVGRSGG